MSFQPVQYTASARFTNYRLKLNYAVFNFFFQTRLCFYIFGRIYTYTYIYAIYIEVCIKVPITKGYYILKIPITKLRRLFLNIKRSNDFYILMCLMDLSRKKYYFNIST